MRRKISSLLLLAFIALAATLTASSHATDVCLGEGTFNITSRATLGTPEGNFTIDFLFLITITRADNGYNVTVLGKIANITGPPVLLQAKLPLFDFTVSTDEGEYRWSDGKTFAAVMLPVSSGAAYKMSIANIKAACIRSVVVDVPGLGLSEVIVIKGLNVYYAAALSTSTLTTRVPYGVTLSQASSTSTYSSGPYERVQPGNAVFASADEGAGATNERIERNAVAAIIALLAAVGVGLLLYTLFT